MPARNDWIRRQTPHFDFFRASLYGRTATPRHLSILVIPSRLHTIPCGRVAQQTFCAVEDFAPSLLMDPIAFVWPNAFGTPHDDPHGTQNLI